MNITIIYYKKISGNKNLLNQLKSSQDKWDPSYHPRLGPRKHEIPTHFLGKYTSCFAHYLGWYTTCLAHYLGWYITCLTHFLDRYTTSLAHYLSR